MSTAEATFRLPPGFGAEWVKDPIDIETWPKAARRVYRYLKRRIRMRKAEHRAKDREIGLEIGEMEGRKAFHRRTVQRGLKFLQDLGGIFRDHSDGHGRVIKVFLPLAGDGTEKTGAAPREGAKAGSGATAAPPPSTPGPDEGPEPELDEETRRVLDESRRRREAEKAKAEANARVEARAEAARAARGGPQSPAGALKTPHEVLQAQLEVIRSRSKAAGDTPDPKPRE